MTFVDYVLTATILMSIVFFGGAAVLAFSWAVKDGQFTNFERASRAIFDPDEPLGEVTDRFPGSPVREIELTRNEIGEIGPMTGAKNRIGEMLPDEPLDVVRRRIPDAKPADDRR